VLCHYALRFGKRKTRLTSDQLRRRGGGGRRKEPRGGRGAFFFGSPFGDYMFEPPPPSLHRPFWRPCWQ
jgi:hypothetical protein